MPYHTSQLAIVRVFFIDPVLIGDRYYDSIIINTGATYDCLKERYFRWRDEKSKWYNQLINIFTGAYEEHEYERTFIVDKAEETDLGVMASTYSTSEFPKIYTYHFPLNVISYVQGKVY